MKWLQRYNSLRAWMDYSYQKPGKTTYQPRVNVVNETGSEPTMLFAFRSSRRCPRHRCMEARQLETTFMSIAKYGRKTRTVLTVKRDGDGDRSDGEGEDEEELLELHDGVVEGIVRGARV